MKYWLIVLGVVGIVLSGCADGGKAPTGPTINVSDIKCQSAKGGRGGDFNGDTSVAVDVNCPTDSNNATAPPFFVSE